MFLTTQYFQWYCTRLIKLKWSVIISAASQYWEISHQFPFLFLSVFSISGLSPWWSLHPLKSLQRIYDFNFVMDTDGKVVLYVWRKRVWVVGHPMVIIWGNGWGVMPPTYVSLAPRTTAIRVLHSITAMCVSLALDNNPPTGARGPLSTAAHCWLADWTMFWCIALLCSALLSCQREASAFGRGVTLSSHCLPSHLQLGGATAPVWGHIWKHTVEKSQIKLLLQYQSQEPFQFKNTVSM